MSDYIALLEAAIARKAFRLHPSLDPNKYQLTESMRDAPTKWKAYSFFGGENYTDPKMQHPVGAMVDVGYVMISLVDDTIVPIARSDEHHCGMDLMYDFSKAARKAKKEPLNPANYIPIFTGGNNYLYDEKDIPNLLIALTKYMAYGGRDGPLKGSYSASHILMNISDFVAAKGSTSVVPDQLAPAGERIYQGFVALAETIRAARDSHQASLTGRAFQQATKFAAQLRPFLSYFGIGEADYAILIKPEIIGNAKKDGDLRKLEELFFGFNGLKNAIHNQARAYVVRQQKGEKDVWRDSEIKSLWGNVELAVDKLGRI